MVTRLKNEFISRTRYIFDRMPNCENGIHGISKIGLTTPGLILDPNTESVASYQFMHIC